MKTISNSQEDEITGPLKIISIRGRLAYGASCLENALEHFGIKSDLLENVVLPGIWEFTSSTDLSEWDKAVNIIDPVCVLDENDPNDPLLALYQSLPAEIVDMISDIIEIGTGNLYGGTGDYSPFTLEPLKRVVLKCMELQIKQPDLDVFKKSSFHEAHGWGLDRDKSYFAS